MPSRDYDAAEEFLDRQSTDQACPDECCTPIPGSARPSCWQSRVIVFRLASTSKFATPTDLGVIAQQTAVVGTLAVGQTLIILTAGIDLSCGAIMVFSSMVMAKTAFDQGVPGLAGHR